MTMTMSNLPMDLVEEILSRVPLKSIRTVRSTCKNWNALSKDQSFANKHIAKAAAASPGEKEFLVFKHSTVDLISVNLHEMHKNNFIKRKGTHTPRETSPKVFLSQVFHCQGLLLCLFLDTHIRLVVWNPYLGKIRSINRRKKYKKPGSFAFGYDKSCGTHKILHIFKNKLEIHDLSSKSWRCCNAHLDRNINIWYGIPGVSVKGDAYWFARDTKSREYFLLCFDFTRESFGLRLPLPLDFTYDYVTCVHLSAVREDQLAMLGWTIQFEIDVWVTNKIESDAVSWRNFFRVKTKRDLDSYWFGTLAVVLDEEKKVPVVFDGCDGSYYVHGESDRQYGEVDLRESPRKLYPTLVCSYPPSSVQL